MQIILLENVKNLGKFGAEVNVANGYGRNFLIPQGKAVPATKRNREQFDSRRVELEAAATSRLQEAQERAALLSDMVVTLRARAGDEGKLFGSIGTLEIVNALKDKGVVIKRQEIRLSSGPLRELGEHVIDLQLHAEVLAQVKITLEPEA